MRLPLSRPSVLVVLVGGLVMSFGSAQAGATTVTCGQTITQDTTVTNDLANCPDGLKIETNDITLDLNGHTIEGTGGGTGIDISADRVAVKNGTIRFTSVLVSGTGNRLRRLRVLSGGILLQGGDHNRLEENEVSAGGIDLVESSENRLERNDVSFGAEGGISIEDTTDEQGEGGGNLLLENLISHTGGDGILLFGSSDNRLIRNVLYTHTGDGVEFRPSVVDIFNFLTPDNNLLVGNRIDRIGGFGVNVRDGNDNAFVGNTVSRSFASGMRLRGSSSVVVGNRVVSNRLDGIEVFERGGRLEANVVFNSGRDGIHVDVGGTLLGNRAEESGDDGIDVGDAFTAVTRNKANRNHDFGIVAVPARPGIDRSGNRASGNGNPAQCLNAACSP